MKTIIKKEFDAVEFMRQQRDRISRETADMNFEQFKEYLASKRPKDRLFSASKIR